MGVRVAHVRLEDPNTQLCAHREPRVMVGVRGHMGPWGIHWMVLPGSLKRRATTRKGPQHPNEPGSKLLLPGLYGRFRSLELPLPMDHGTS